MTTGLDRALDDTAEQLRDLLDAPSSLIVEYLRFLELAASYPNERSVPSLAVDALWHRHQVRSADYAAFCRAQYGASIRHGAGFGSDDPALLRETAERTRQRYISHFGAEPSAVWDPDHAAACSNEPDDGGGGGDDDGGW